MLIKDVIKPIENQTKEQKDGFISALLGTLSATLLKIMLSGLTEKRVVRVVDRVIQVS